MPATCVTMNPPPPMFPAHGNTTVIANAVATNGLAQAKTLSRDAAATPPESSRHWSLGTITATLRFSDYGGVARIDFFVRELGQNTVVLAFMYSPRFSWNEAIAEIVDSFVWPGGVPDRLRMGMADRGPVCTELFLTGF